MVDNKSCYCKKECNVRKNNIAISIKENTQDATNPAQR